MPNIGKMFKDEIERISQRSARAAAVKLRKELVRVKSALAQTKRDMAQLRKKVSALPAVRAASPATAGESAPAKRGSKSRSFTAQRIRSLRAKLGLTQAQFGTLAGVSSQAVNLWEHKSGVLRLRNKTIEALSDLKGIRKREALRRLESVASPKAAPKAKPAGAQKKVSRKKAVRAKKRS